MAKSYHMQAQEAGVPAITTAGIYPGVSNRVCPPALKDVQCTSCVPVTSSRCSLQTLCYLVPVIKLRDDARSNLAFAVLPLDQPSQL